MSELLAHSFYNATFPVPYCRSPSELHTRRWNVKVLMTKAVWDIMPCPGACTGPGLVSPSGTMARKNCWALPRPDELVSIWTSMQGFWHFTASQTTRLTSSICTGPSSLARCIQGSGFGPEQLLQWLYANWIDCDWLFVLLYHYFMSIYYWYEYFIG